MPNWAHFWQSHEVNPAHRLQRTAGNQAVQQLLQHAQPENLGVNSGTTAAARSGQDFSQAPVISKSPLSVQAKLAVNTPGDIYEQEADRVSEQIMNMPDLQPRRACSCEGGCQSCRVKQPSQQRERLWAKHTGSNDVGQIAVPPIVHEVLSSPGQPLDPAARDFIEPRFGQDFSRIQVHTDAKAAESAQAIDAAAYTVGQDVVFGAGQYAPGTAEGRRLLAHELTHVVQQAGARPQAVQRQPAHNDVADLELQLRSKILERAMLARLFEEAQKKSTADVYDRRINTGSKKEEAKLKAGAQADLQKVVPMDVLKNKIDVVRAGSSVTLKVRFELSYPGLTDTEGSGKASTDIRLIENAIRNAWTINLTEGRYSGSKFQLEPQIEFRPNARKRNDRALQFIVRRDSKGPSVADWSHGEVSFNPEHLQGNRIVIAAHELYHLLGWIIDSYYIPDKKLKGDPNNPAMKYSVGRPDATGRGDLLGMVDPVRLREWRDSGVISQADFDRQTRAQVTVWQEDADKLLYALGVPPNAGKPPALTDPTSPGFDPQEALRAIETKGKQKLADIERDTDRYAEIADSVQQAERAIQLDKEIAALQKKIAQLKSGGAKGPARP
jgi:hypothetical protein